METKPDPWLAMVKPTSHRSLISIASNFYEKYRLKKPEITRQDLVIPGDHWFDTLGETKHRREGLKSSQIPADIVARAQNERLQTFLNHFFLQPDFNQVEYTLDPKLYIRSHSEKIIPELSRESNIAINHRHTNTPLSWVQDSNLEQISDYLGLG